MITDKPLVSIISGYYNRQDSVVDSVKSLLNQTYENIEIIIFDDCSTDDTYNKLLGLQKIDPRLKVVCHKVNKGFVQGLIDAIDISNGEFLAIHGSGDISYPQRIETQIEYIKSKANIGVVASYSEYGRAISNDTYIRKTKVGRITLEDLIEDNPITHGSALIRKSFYKKVNGYRSFFKMSQDRDLWMRLSLVSEVHVIPQVLYKVNIASNGVSTVLNKKINQKFYSRFCNKLIKMRVKGGLDYVDLFGEDAKFFINNKEAIRFFRITGVKLYYHNKDSDLFFLLSTMLDIDGSNVATVLYVHLMKGLLRIPKLRPIVSRVLLQLNKSLVKA